MPAAYIFYKNDGTSASEQLPFMPATPFPDPAADFGWSVQGKTFKGWNTESDGSGTFYYTGGTILTETTFYAIWEAPVVTYLTTDRDLTSIANAIRTKGGTSAQLAFPQGFVDAVEAIETGGGGDYTAADIFDNTKPVGDVTFEGTYIGALNNNTAPGYFSYREGIGKVYCPNFNTTANSAGGFRNSSMTHGVFPKLSRIYNATFFNCTSLVAFDWCGGTFTGSANDQFRGCTKFNTLVIRKNDSIVNLPSINIFTNTPFASGKAGGTLYVPQAMIASYQAATNWSTILGYANNNIQAIEGSIYETQYVDGTPIPTT